MTQTGPHPPDYDGRSAWTITTAAVDRWSGRLIELKKGLGDLIKAFRAEIGLHYRQTGKTPSPGSKDFRRCRAIEGQFSVVPSGFGNCCKSDVLANRGESPAHAIVVASLCAQAFLEFLKRRANVFRQRMMPSPQIIDLDESDPSPV